MATVREVERAGAGHRNLRLRPARCRFIHSPCGLWVRITISLAKMLDFNIGAKRWAYGL